jgi:hypothetical protein
LRTREHQTRQRERGCAVAEAEFRGAVATVSNEILGGCTWALEEKTLAAAFLG